MDRYRSRDVRRGRGRGGRVDGAVWMGIACKQQITNNTNLLPQPSQLTAIAPAEPIPPHYILLALCLLARPSQSVFRVQCLCVSPPSDLRLQRTWTPRRVRAAHPPACLAQRPTFFVQAVRHIPRPAGWLGRLRKNDTPARTRPIE